jgi:hypothetical protein
LAVEPRCEWDHGDLAKQMMAAKRGDHAETEPKVHGWRTPVDRMFA